jgi:hypothetical protein
VRALLVVSFRLPSAAAADVRTSAEGSCVALITTGSERFALKCPSEETAEDRTAGLGSLVASFTRIGTERAHGTDGPACQVGQARMPISRA